MEWTEIKPNEKMTQTVKDCLEMQKDNISLYARKRIDDLETEVLKLSKANVSGRSELLFAFIAEVKKEFADQNWDYLDFIAERVLKANNSH